MSLTLSSADLQALSDALKLLLSPLDYPNADDWRLAVNRDLKCLLRADSAGFLLPVSNGHMMLSEEHDQSVLATYQDIPPPPLPDGTPVEVNLLRLGVASIEDVYNGNPGVYLASPYYHEYAGANGAHDPLSAGISVGGDDWRGAACVHFWHDRAQGRQFGMREIGMLKLLFPAFRAGVETQLRWGAHRTFFLSALDSLGHAVQICDMTGAIVHRTPALLDTLRLDPQQALLLKQMELAVHAVRMAARFGGGDGAPSGPVPVVKEVQTEFARYRVRASLYGGGEYGPAPLIMISLERATPIPLAESELRARYTLTRTEIRVATLIAKGHSNADIAGQIFISPHTARRHTERILHKMGIRSRAEVALKLFS